MNGFKLAERLPMNEHEVRLKHISKCRTIQIFSACLSMMHKLYLLTLSHMPWYVLTPHTAGFGLMQIKKGGKKSQFNLDYQQPHPLWPWQFPGETNACLQWHFIWPICSTGAIVGWNMEYEWVPSPLGASIRDHLRGPGPLLRGCRGCEATLFEVRSGGGVCALVGGWCGINETIMVSVYLKMRMTYNNYYFLVVTNGVLNLITW